MECFPAHSVGLSKYFQEIKQDITGKVKQSKILKNYRPIFFMNIHRKNISHNTGKSNPEKCKKEYIPLPNRIYPRNEKLV